MTLRAVALLLLLLALGSCAGEQTGPTCQSDEHCPRAEICHEQACVRPSSLACPADGSSTGKISVTPTSLDFGTIGLSSELLTLTVSNQGSCSLELLTAELGAGSGSRFRCPVCAPGELPLQVYPSRSVTLDIEVTPGPAGDIQDELVLQSTDSETRYVRIPLLARSEGLPELSVTPTALDFGYVPVGQTESRVVEVLNTNEGRTALEVTGLELAPIDSQAFSFEPRLTQPVSVESALVDPSSRFAITVSYHPQEVAEHEAELRITPLVGEPLKVTLHGSDTPPAIVVSKTSIDFGTVRVGDAATTRITVQNTGSSPLRVLAYFASNLADLTLLQSMPGEIKPGGLVELGVHYTPTVAGPLSTQLIFTSNDPDHPSISVPVTATGEAIPGEEVIAVELRFENDSDSILDRDVRDVDLMLENPTGLVCGESTPNASWGALGTARWSGSPPREMPERIVLGRVTQDGSYAVLLSYIEDCSSLPTALAASLLGVGSEALADYLSGGDVQLDPAEVSAIVSEVCVNHRGSTAQLKVTVNGQPLRDLTRQLGSKGDFVTAFRLVREAGRFQVVE